MLLVTVPRWWMRCSREVTEVLPCVLLRGCTFWPGHLYIFLVVGFIGGGTLFLWCSCSCTPGYGLARNHFQFPFKEMQRVDLSWLFLAHVGHQDPKSWPCPCIASTLSHCVFLGPGMWLEISPSRKTLKETFPAEVIRGMRSGGRGRWRSDKWKPQVGGYVSNRQDH